MAPTGPQAASLPVVIGSGSHPFPFRTRKLSLLPPMVLHGKLCGRVGRCRHYSLTPDRRKTVGRFVCTSKPSAPQNNRDFGLTADKSRHEVRLRGDAVAVGAEHRSLTMIYGPTSS